MPEERPRRTPADTVLVVLLLVGVAGHALGFWEIPRLGAPSSGESAGLDPRSIIVAYSRIQTGGTSPWLAEDTTRVMERFVQRWSEATLGRSRVVVMDETELRDVLIVFNDKFVTPPAEARLVRFAGGRLRYIEVFAQPRVLRADIDYTANTLLHELAHALGCCTGPGTVGFHWTGTNCVRILCSPHGSAQTFSEDELRQMGLGN